jgi:hypothetical protein
MRWLWFNIMAIYISVTSIKFLLVEAEILTHTKKFRVPTSIIRRSELLKELKYQHR